MTEQHDSQPFQSSADQFPPLRRQAWNLARSLADFVADGCKTVSEEDYRRRLEICDGCDRRRGTGASSAAAGSRSRPRPGVQLPLGKWPPQADQRRLPSRAPTEQRGVHEPITTKPNDSITSNPESRKETTMSCDENQIGVCDCAWPKECDCEPESGLKAFPLPRVGGLPVCSCSTTGSSPPPPQPRICTSTMTSASGELDPSARALRGRQLRLRRARRPASLQGAPLQLR